MIEATAHRLALHGVHVERVVGNCRREILKHGSKPDGRSEVTACAGPVRSLSFPSADAPMTRGMRQSLADRHI
jgi:hypothetical protein